MTVNWFPGAAKPQPEKEKPEKKRSQAPATRLLPPPVKPVTYWEVEQPCEVQTADGIVDAEPGDIVEVSENYLAVRPREADPREWKFTPTKLT